MCVSIITANNGHICYTYVMCKILLRHNGRPNSSLFRQKHELVG